MNRHFILSIVGVTAFAGLSSAHAQTVTVSKTGSPTYSTIQEAINHFTSDPDTNVPNVIQVLDDAVYDELITITAPLTLEGTGSNRPIITPQLNSGNDGMNIQIDNGQTSNAVYLRNLIVIPSLTAPPTDDGICSIGQNLYVEIDNVLVTANNGSNQPVSVTGLAEVDTSGATFFGDDGIYLGGTLAPAGPGTEVFLRDTVVTHLRNAGAGRDGLVLGGNTGTRFNIGEGCVFSYNGRLGIQAGSDVAIEGSDENPVMIVGNAGFAGLWYGSGSPNVRRVSHAIIANNTAMGIEQQNGGAATFELTDSVVVNNGSNALMIADNLVAAPAAITRSTLGNSTAGPAIGVSAANTFDVTITDSIIIGNGSANADNTIQHDGTGALIFSGSAAVTAGPHALTTVTGGTGTVSGAPTTTADPEFVDTTDFTSDDFFDVAAGVYSTASSTNGPLGGGADFVGTSDVETWSIY